MGRVILAHNSEEISHGGEGTTAGEALYGGWEFTVWLVHFLAHQEIEGAQEGSRFVLSPLKPTPRGLC